MTFLNPQAFWGLCLLIIPLIVHLFSFRRYKKVLFSNLAFLSEIKEQKQSSSTIKKFLVLLSRLLFLFFLIVAFAQPTLEKGDEIAIGSSLVYFDNSLSMQQVDHTGEPLLFIAYNGLETIIGNELQSVKLMSNDAIMNYTGIESDISELQRFSAGSVNLGAIVDKQELYGSDKVSLISDFQKNGFELSIIEQDTSSSFELYQLIPGKQSNVFIDSVWLSIGGSQAETEKLLIELGNSGGMEISDGLVQLKQGDRQIASQTFNLGAEGRTRIEMSLETGDRIYGAYTLELADAPVVFDNKFHFNIIKPSQANVVLVEEGNSQTGDFVAKLYSNRDYFNFTRENISATSLSRLSNVDLLILSELSVLPEWLLSQIGLIKGKVLVIPSGHSEVDSYQKLLSVGISLNENERLQPLNAKSLAHPFLARAFTRDLSNRASLPQFRSIFNLTGYFENLLETNEGLPVLSHFGNTSMYLLNTPLSDDYTNFQKHALFIPIMYRLAQKNIQDPLFHRLDEEYVQIGVDSIVNNAILKLSSADNSFIPSYRFSTQGLKLEIPEEMHEPGIYYLTNDSDTLGVFAFNYSLSESDIHTHSPEELSRLANENAHISYYPINTNALSSASFNMNKESDSLWKYALLLALSFILIESILLRFLK